MDVSRFPGFGAPCSLWREGLDTSAVGTSAVPPERADVVVVGAGLVGLTTALLLAQAGREVVVVEASQVGRLSVTTASTVKVTVGHGTQYSAIRSSRGEQVAARYAEANQAGFATILGLIDSLGIDCGLEVGLPHVIYAERDEERATLDDEAEVAARLGLAATRTSSAPVPFDVVAGLRFEDQAQLHPGQYLLGLARALRSAGGQLVEGARVLDVDEGRQGCLVRTTVGDVRASHVVVATQYPILDRGLHFARTKAYRSYAIAGVLPPGVTAEMTMNVGSPTRSTRTVERDGELLLVVVGESHPVGRAQDAAQRWGRLRDWAAERFGVQQVRHHWSAQETVSLDHVPYVGRISPRSGRVLTATGFGGWGFTNGTAAALMMRDLVVGQDNPWLPAFDARRASTSLPGWQELAHNAQVGATWVTDQVAAHRSRPLAQLEPGDAVIMRVAGEACAVHRDDDGVVHCVSARCTHLGCTVAWNSAERSWDCPCHGSRFAPDGRVLQAPATRPLEPRPLPASTETTAGRQA